MVHVRVWSHSVSRIRLDIKLMKLRSKVMGRLEFIFFCITSCTVQKQFTSIFYSYDFP